MPQQAPNGSSKYMLALKTILFTVIAPGTVTAFAPFVILQSGLTLLSIDTGPVRYLGLLSIALGVAFYAWCASDFVMRGRGTPAPVDAPRVLVSKGLYRSVRNPMYVGVLLILLGEVVLFESLTLLLYALLVWVMFHSFVIFYEEPALKSSFGAAYEHYSRAVPRWIPRLPPAPATAQTQAEVRGRQ